MSQRTKKSFQRGGSDAKAEALLNDSRKELRRIAARRRIASVINAILGFGWLDALTLLVSWTVMITTIVNSAPVVGAFGIILAWSSTTVLLWKFSDLHTAQRTAAAAAPQRPIKLGSIVVEELPSATPRPRISRAHFTDPLYIRTRWALRLGELVFGVLVAWHQLGNNARCSDTTWLAAHPIFTSVCADSGASAIFIATGVLSAIHAVGGLTGFILEIVLSRQMNYYRAMLASAGRI